MLRKGKRLVRAWKVTEIDFRNLSGTAGFIQSQKIKKLADVEEGSKKWIII